MTSVGTRWWLIAAIAIFITSCNDRSRTLTGSYIRYSGEYPITEHWEICLKSDGKCNAVNTANGFVNYTLEYSGTWSDYSEDIIKIEMESEVHVSHVTRSNYEVDYEANKAQNPWKRNQVFANSGKLKTIVGTDTQTFYIRDDGATAFYPSGLDNPLMICR